MKVCSLVEEHDGSFSIILECPGGKITPDIVEIIPELVKSNGADIHLTTSQKMMIMDLNEQTSKEVLAILENAGVTLKKGRDMSQAMVCVGKPYCRLALQETFPFAEYLYKEIARIPILPKLKVGISGCPACCAWTNLADIGFMGIKKGFRMFIGGHGGYKPKIGIDVGRVVSYGESANIVKKLVHLFNAQTEKKGRLDKVIDKIGIDNIKAHIGIQ